MLLTPIKKDLIGDRWLIIIDCFENDKPILFEYLEKYTTKEHTDCSIPLYFSTTHNETLLKANKKIIVCSQLMQILIHFSICSFTGDFEMLIKNPLRPSFYMHGTHLFKPSTTDVAAGLNGDITVIGKMDVHFCPACGFVMSNTDDGCIKTRNEQN